MIQATDTLGAAHSEEMLRETNLVAPEMGKMIKGANQQ